MILTISRRSLSEGNTMSAAVTIGALGRLGRFIVDQSLTAGTPSAQTVVVPAGIGRPATTAHEAAQNAVSVEEESR
jgi:hypothetical protein